MAFGQGLTVPFIRFIRAYTMLPIKGTMANRMFMVSKGLGQRSYPGLLKTLFLLHSFGRA